MDMNVSEKSKKLAIARTFFCIPLSGNKSVEKKEVARHLVLRDQCVFAFHRDDASYMWVRIRIWAAVPPPQAWPVLCHTVRKAGMRQSGGQRAQKVMTK